jgi:hypothetical protein
MGDIDHVIYAFGVEYARNCVREGRAGPLSVPCGEQHVGGPRSGSSRSVTVLYEELNRRVGAGELRTARGLLAAARELKRNPALTPVARVMLDGLEAGARSADQEGGR